MTFSIVLILLYLKNLEFDLYDNDIRKCLLFPKVKWVFVPTENKNIVIIKFFFFLYFY